MSDEDTKLIISLLNDKTLGIGLDSKGGILLQEVHINTRNERVRTTYRLIADIELMEQVII